MCIFAARLINLVDKKYDSKKVNLVRMSRTYVLCTCMRTLKYRHIPPAAVEEEVALGTCAYALSSLDCMRSHALLEEREEPWYVGKYEKGSSMQNLHCYIVYV